MTTTKDHPPENTEMTKATKAEPLTPSYVRAEQEQAEADLQAACLERDAAAYASASAPDDELAQQRLSEAASKVTTARARLEGFGALVRQADRVSAVESRQRQDRQLRDYEQKAHALIDVAGDACARVLSAIDELGAAWAALKDAEYQAQNAEVHSFQRSVAVGGNAHALTHYKGLVGDLHTQLLGGELDHVRIGGRPDRGREWIEAELIRTRARAKASVTRNIASQLADI